MARPTSFETTIRPILLRFAKEIARVLQKNAPKPVKDSGNGRRKRRRGLNPDVVFKLLKGSKAGVAIGELADKLGANRPRVSAALQKLREDKRAKVVGIKRNARWHAA
jgi:hypothetical protein